VSGLLGLEGFGRGGGKSLRMWCRGFSTCGGPGSRRLKPSGGEYFSKPF
jgi:hypothetical protein